MAQVQLTDLAEFLAVEPDEGEVLQRGDLLCLLHVLVVHLQHHGGQAGGHSHLQLLADLLELRLLLDENLNLLLGPAVNEEVKLV